MFFFFLLWLHFLLFSLIVGRHEDCGRWCYSLQQTNVISPSPNLLLSTLTMRSPGCQIPGRLGTHTTMSARSWEIIASDSSDSDLNWAIVMGSCKEHISTTFKCGVFIDRQEMSECTFLSTHMLVTGEKFKTRDIAFLSGCLSSESRILSLIFVYSSYSIVVLEEASESDQDPGHLNYSVHLGWLHRVCDNPCCHF